MPAHAAGVKIVKLFEVPNYCEGIVFDHAGNGYISHGKVITKFTPDGKHAVWAEIGEPNGHKILADGTHLVCDASHHAVLHIDADGKILGKASGECDGKQLRGPNDLHSGSRRTAASTSPIRAAPTTRSRSAPSTTSTPRARRHLVAEGLAYPNGIVLRPDGKTLLVAESKKNRILAYRSARLRARSAR